MRASAAHTARNTTLRYATQQHDAMSKEQGGENDERVPAQMDHCSRRYLDDRPPSPKQNDRDAGRCTVPGRDRVGRVGRLDLFDR